MNDLTTTLRLCLERITKYRRQGPRIGEQNTKAGLIEPVLAALGWDLYDAEEVNREYRRRSIDNPVDYALLLLRTPRLFVEAKGLGENLNDPKWTNQTIAYASAAGVEWVVLTDGAEWRILNAHAPVPAEEKLFRSVRLEADLGQVASTLSLLGKAEIGDNRIEELWRSQFDDKRVHAVLVEMFNPIEPSRDLVNLVTKRVPSLDRAAVKASLRRVRAQFDFPTQHDVARPAPTMTVTVPPPVALALPAAPSGPSASSRPSGGVTAPRQRPGRVPVSADEAAMKLSDLVRLGVVPGGTQIVADYFGERHIAEVTDTGTVRFKGQEYRSLSSAGEAVKIALRGADLAPSIKATDGWGFWKMQTPQGLLALLIVRRRATNQTS